ncbi:putative secreted protein (Por secretion system target) [Winogradskyella pacifica]|uniref:Putative secreted protein (Por secretion system target) n=1 Tax=Winogradskyella pacifica TaxID=664642 RepID=A0A3D9N851_9FLAO|nr:M12 family metallo-peptidase [Winogradskyella pacifica]REE27975.1 putative secreted protein (Por secretion system target) [Winogradskyella pacifica]
MLKNYVLKISTIIIVLFSMAAQGQNSSKLWTSLNAEKAKQSEQISRKINLKSEKFFQLKIEQLKTKLQTIGDRENPGNTIISFPNSDGELSRFKVFEASIMEPKLQAQFPNMRSYAGQGIDNPTEIVRFSITSKGLHAMFLGTSNGTQFIDPFSKVGNIYTVYSKRDLTESDFEFQCGVIDEDLDLDAKTFNDPITKNASDGTLRNYRTAIACTGEYAAFHGGTVAGAMAAIVTTMTRINGIYERELSITMTLVANNANLVYTDAATDPFDNDNGNLLIQQSHNQITAQIGTANFDIGHTFSTSSSGGLASLGSTCVNSRKGKGITGSTQPIGDAYDVDYVAHELGHQFGAPHTFNGTVGSCSGVNRSSSSAYEPGSGTTIMAYAGICGSDNIQIGSDAYFHQNSINTIWNHVTSSGACPVDAVPTGNTQPVANAGANYIIPQGTPYKLNGNNSNDVDGMETLTYTWEQYDLGTAGLPTETTTTGPLVRSFEGTNNPVRYVPRLEDILVNGGTSTTWEKLVTISRNINFMLTVRDNDARGGQTDSDQMTATVTTAAGPFVVTSQNVDGVTWDVGTTQTVTWNVAGTTGNGVNEANVNILLATDGQNFDTVLALNVPNDGSHDITVPDVASSSNRIMVEAANGIFFNVNNENIAIGVAITCDTYSASGDNIGVSIADGTGSTTPINGPVLQRTLNVPDNFTIESLKLNIDVDHTFVGDLLVQLLHPDGVTEAVIWSGNCSSSDDILIKFEDGASAIDCSATGSGNTYSPVEPLSIFEGLDSQGDWTILIADFYSGDTGILQNWSLEFCSESLSVDDNELDQLSIYPNPNNGAFNIQFNPKSGEDVSVAVYDIRGRSIYTKSFQNTGRFEETIQLNNAQSGVYLLTIVDGSQKVTKKIIVD